MFLGSQCIFFFFLVFVSYPPSSPNRTQPKQNKCSELDAVKTCMPKIWGIPSLKNREYKTTYFRHFSRTSQLNVNFNGRYLRNNIRCKQSGRAQGSLHRPKISRTLVHKRLIIRPEFLATLHKFCTLLRCQGSHTKVSKKEHTQPNFAKRYRCLTVNV